MIKRDLIEKITQAAQKAGFSDLVKFDLKEPPDSAMGDFATNIALVLGSEKKISPHQIAQKIRIVLQKENTIEKVEVAGPGFINIWLGKKTYFSTIGDILKLGEKFGKKEIGLGKKIQVEYISANPTGPLHVGNARGGPIGEALANLYQFLGYEVDREFYVNDIGGQIDKLGETLYYWSEKINGQNIIFPEGGYRGDYIETVAKEIIRSKKSQLEKLKNKEEFIEFFKIEGVNYILEMIKNDMKLLGIEFNSFVYQSQIEKEEKPQKIVKRLIDKKAVDKREGAVWFKSYEGEKDEDKDSVLQKSDEDGTFTYFACDIAYHIDKYERGFAKIVDIWGANHHGHVKRLQEALGELGVEPGWLTVLLYQYVRLKEGDKKIKMAKREGNMVTLRQVIESGVTADAFKYFILMQNLDTPIDFDLKLASDTTEKNPVFYIQYAHARICSILRKANREEASDEVDFTLLNDPREEALIKELSIFPELLLEISDSFQIQALPHYAYKIATMFHDFYSNCLVLSEDKKMTLARLSLVKATKIVLKNALTICAIDAPERM